MRIILQRVTDASVTIEYGETRSLGGPGLVALVGFGPGDTARECGFLAAKTAELRIFEDENGAMNLSVLDIGGGCLIVPNFTLYANARKGRRPSFIGSLPPGEATLLFDYFVGLIRERIPHVETGKFGAHMDVTIHNSGPVTITLDSDEIMPKKA